ncbi:glycosyltransferase [Gillisia sp. M10.2A]|uniref:Glycosyltransferase n=1 Tax=Gillisia lutea TaxID=2909668 RepID=A0ABS9EHT6_9FLAO|nr:glycosyltransferase [Gillisia lutea]MCF4102428.1 glycosyltransferase [Gillisia lutea]
MAITLLVAFLIFSIINILFYIGYFSFSAAKSQNTTATNIPVSVIICAKNEAENLKQFIPNILNQEYSNFEVILINDASSDDTFEVMENFRDIDPRVKLVNVENNEAFWGKKKYALTLGIKKASNPYLLFTDADCVPESNLWIQKMVINFIDEKSIVLGYGGYFKQKLSFLNKLIRFETMLTAIQYFSYSKLGIPYMGVGRNLAYTSAEFYNQNGFATHLHLKSGDDDLFVNQAATKFNTAICFDKDAITRSVPKSDYKSWIQQKRRHITTAKYYKFNHKLLLGTFFLSQLVFWILFIGLLALQFYWPIVLGVFILRLIIQYIVFWKSAKKLDELDLLWAIPVLEFFLILIQIGIFSSNLFSKPTNWK